MAAMSIAELARGAGVGVETVRYYQRRGLLSDPRPRRTGAQGVRHYGPEEAQRLRFIRAAKAAGFTLDEIARLLKLHHTGGRPEAREMARERIAVLDRKIAELRHARRSLTKLARECAAGGNGPCPIIAAFDGTA